MCVRVRVCALPVFKGLFWLRSRTPPSCMIRHEVPGQAGGVPEEDNQPSERCSDLLEAQTPLPHPSDEETSIVSQPIFDRSNLQTHGTPTPRYIYLGTYEDDSCRGTI